jgi:group I intron endonuclease
MKITKKIIELLNLYYYIYKYTFKQTGQIYIGVTKDPISRFKAHKSKSKSKSKDSRLNRAILKYGIENFTIEIIDGHKDIDIAKKQETGWIGQYKDSGYELYNISRGGACYDEESIERMKKANTGWTMPQEQRDKISKTTKGRPKLEITKQKMSKAAKGKKKSEEARKNMSIAQKANPNRFEQARYAGSCSKGAIRTQEFKDNLREIFKGEGSTSAILTEKQVIEILKISKDTKLSQREIGLLFGVDRRTINQIVNGKRWKYIDRSFLNEIANHQVAPTEVNTEALNQPTQVQAPAGPGVKV